MPINVITIVFQKFSDLLLIGSVYLSLKVAFIYSSIFLPSLINPLHSVVECTWKTNFLTLSVLYFMISLSCVQLLKDKYIIGNRINNLLISVKYLVVSIK